MPLDGPRDEEPARQGARARAEDGEASLVHVHLGHVNEPRRVGVQQLLRCVDGALFYRIVQRHVVSYIHVVNIRVRGCVSRRAWLLVVDVLPSMYAWCKEPNFLQPDVCSI